jgi:predicted nuclease of predicted toxin-antitoxin system
MLLIDNNISSRLVSVLRGSYPGIKHVADVGLDDADDVIVWEFAKSNHLNIVSKDADFNDIQQIEGFPPKIIWIRSGNCSTKYVKDLLLENEVEIKSFLLSDELGLLEIR